MWFVAEIIVVHVCSHGWLGILIFEENQVISNTLFAFFLLFSRQILLFALICLTSTLLHVIMESCIILSLMILYVKIVTIKIS